MPSATPLPTRSARRIRAPAPRSRRAWSTATSRRGTRRASQSRTSINGALCLNLLFDLTPIARRGSRFPETTFGGLLDDGVGPVDVLHQFQRELTFGGVVLGRPAQRD